MAPTSTDMHFEDSAVVNVCALIKFEHVIPCLSSVISYCKTRLSLISVAQVDSLALQLHGLQF